jgi:hypothetical protein
VLSPFRNRSLSWMFLVPCLCALNARAEIINVSKIATGTNIDLSSTLLLLPANNGATLTYFSTGDAKVGSESTSYYAPAPWNAAEEMAPQAPVVIRKTTLSNYISGSTHFDYDLNYTEKGTVDTTQTPRVLGATVYKKGSASSVLSYNVRIDHTSATSLYYFIDLSVPKISHSVQPAWSLSSPDDNGGTYSYQRPKSAISRAMVDIYVNDLPVWSSESGYMYPLGATDPFAEFDFAWGSNSGPHTSSLFLGRLSQGQSMTITFVARTEGTGDGNSCGTEYYDTFYPPTVALHCFDMNETILMNGDHGHTPAFDIHSTYTSPIFRGPPFTRGTVN